MTAPSAAARERSEDSAFDASSAGPVDFDLHGIVGVRLVDASPSDIRAVTRQLGPLRSALTREPDIVVRFVDALPAASGLRYLDLDDAAFDDESFYVLRRVRDRHLRARIPLEHAGSRCEIVCESGLGSVPLLVAIVNLTMLAHDVVPVHGSAFTYEGTGALVMGWAKGGKTEVLLGFMDRGAQYVGDEWVYVDPDGKRSYGLPEPIRIWDWHLDDLARYRGPIGAGSRTRMWLARRAGASRLALPDSFARSDTGELVGRAIALVERQSSVRVPPERLFGSEACVLQGTVDKVLFVVSHEGPGVTVEDVDCDDLATRMPFSHQHERGDLLGAYLQTRFAFPDRVNALLDGARERESALLAEALSGKQAYLVRHPFPASIPALVDAVAPLL